MNDSIAGRHTVAPSLWSKISWNHSAWISVGRMDPSPKISCQETYFLCEHIMSLAFCKHDTSCFIGGAGHPKLPWHFLLLFQRKDIKPKPKHIICLKLCYKNCCMWNTFLKYLCPAKYVCEKMHLILTLLGFTSNIYNALMCQFSKYTITNCKVPVIEIIYYLYSFKFFF